MLFRFLFFIVSLQLLLGERSNKEANDIYDSIKDKLNKLKPGDYIPANIIKKLFESAEYNHLESLEFLSTAFFLSDGVMQNIPLSKKYFDNLSHLGHPRGQFGQFLFDSYGFAGHNKSLSSAIANLHFSALQGDTFSEMALAYRYLYGINVMNSCENSLMYYSRVAKKVVESLRKKIKDFGYLSAAGSGVHRIKLQEESSNSGLGMTIPSTALIDDEFLNYMKFMADKNNVSAQISLGQLYYQGSHGVPEDHDKALYHFKSAYAAGNVLAGSYLGEIYMHGTSSSGKDEVLGLQYLKEAAEKQNPIGQTGLGLAHYYGKGGLRRDVTKAMEHIRRAADQGWPDAQFYMAMFYLGEMDFENFKSNVDHRVALKYLSLASQHGNILGIYYLALMHSTGTGVLRNCNTATLFFKNVAERGSWSYYFNSAHALYHAGSTDLAFSQYLLLAEMGFEVAASNVAFLLEEGNVKIVPKEDQLSIALMFLHRSANQDNAESRIKIGDYYYYGTGIKVDYEMAVQNYRIASEQFHNPQAMFNLAYMHEQGLGFKKDLHLAKRYYDLAAQTSTDAFFPTLLALSKIQVLMSMETFIDSLKKYPAILSVISKDLDLVIISILVLALTNLFIYKFYLSSQRNNNTVTNSPETSNQTE